MKIEDYNPKAREALGKNLVDISLAINKGIILLITIIPLGYIAKTVVVGAGDPIGFIEFVSKMSFSTYTAFLNLLIISFSLGYVFREKGLKHIHESENLKT